MVQPQATGCEPAPIRISEKVMVQINSLEIARKLQEAVWHEDIELVNEIINGPGCKIEYL